MDMVRQFQHVENLIRRGRAHDPTGILATKPGELTEPCRACPHKGKNVPENIDSLPVSLR
jgi:hypothetical protein